MSRKKKKAEAEWAETIEGVKARLSKMGAQNFRIKSKKEGGEEFLHWTALDKNGQELKYRVSLDRARARVDQLENNRQ